MGYNSESSNERGIDLQHNSHTSLSRYVIYLEGEEGLVDLMMENNSDATAHWIRMGEKQQPRNLLKLLEQLNSLTAFSGTREFDNDIVPSLSPDEPPNCWALPVVTLTSIAVSLPDIDQEQVERLVRSVDEGLKYVSEIENYLDKKQDLKHMRKAAEIVWSQVELYHKWLDVDLYKLAHQQEPGTGTAIIKLLADISKEKFMKLMSSDLMFMHEYCKDLPSRWPMKVLAANSMYRICETLLLGQETKQHEINQRLFENISLMICKILAAACTNLQHVITSKCHENKIEEREKSIRSAVLLYGKTKKILEILDQKLEGSDHGRLVHIDDWHLVSKHMDPLNCVSSSTDEETAESSPSDLHISIA